MRLEADIGQQVEERLETPILAGLYPSMPWLPRTDRLSWRRSSHSQPMRAPHERNGCRRAHPARFRGFSIPIGFPGSAWRYDSTDRWPFRRSLFPPSPVAPIRFNGAVAIRGRFAVPRVLTGKYAEAERVSTLGNRRQASGPDLDTVASRRNRPNEALREALVSRESSGNRPWRYAARWVHSAGRHAGRHL